VKVSSLLFVMALAAGRPAAAPSTAQPPPAKPPATSPSGQAPVTQPPAPTTAGQTTAGQTPAAPGAPPPAVPASRRFTSDAGMMFSVIKPDKTADFEAVMARVKEALGKSQDPKRKQQALSWRVFKALEAAGTGGNVLYIWFLDPAVKDEEYVITGILAEAFPNEVQDLWAKYTACFVSGQTMLNLQMMLNMSPTAAIVK
jgi:pyruvate/2-oxoglutarate dehydrogenase complex dihydrolipoamide acyltransferase (E2) component